MKIFGSDYKIRFLNHSELSKQAETVNPISHGIFKCHVPWGGGYSSTPIQKKPRGCFCPIFFLIPAKLIYNCRSHAKRHSQKLKIERVEEL